MTLDELATFVTVLREGSISRAAILLERSQSALSRRIDQLEASLGCSLVDRSAALGVLGPTEAGRALLPHAEVALAAACDARRAVEAVHRGGHGEVSLVLVGTLATATLSEALRRFVIACPTAQIALRTAVSRKVSALVRRGDATLGLRYGEDPDPALEGSVLGQERLVAVAGQRLAQRLPAGADATVLQDFPWIGFPAAVPGAGSAFGEVLRRQRAAAGLEDSPFLAVDSLTTQLQLVEADLGLGLLPMATVKEALGRGSLVRVPAAAALEASVPVVLIWRRGAYLSAAAQMLKATITDWHGPAH
jgi:DNA-binding transcriptional LysR family regulator